MDGCLPESGWGHPFCFALDPFVVVVIDVFLYRSAEIFECLEFRFVSVEHLVLEGPEERFHDAVVDAVALPGHRLDDAHLPEPSLIHGMLVLPAHVAVHDEAAQIRVFAERHVEHPIRLFQVRGRGQVESHDVARSHVQDLRQIRLPERAAELGDVGRPFPVRGVAGEIPVYHVFRDPPCLPLVGTAFLPLPLAAQGHLFHQPLDLLVVDGDALVPQGGVHPADAVSPFVSAEDVLDAFPQVRVPVRSGEPPQLEIVGRSALAGDLKEEAQAAPYLPFDGLDDFRFFALASLAVFSNSKALNFFR